MLVTGSGRLDNSCSILEALDAVGRISDKEVKSHYPEWDITISLETMLVEMVNRFKADL